MKVIMVMVTSLNGKITRGDDPDIYKWTSEEDHDFFLEQIRNSNLIVMGSGTYEAAKPTLKLSSERLRIVLTRNPEKYKEQVVPGKLEFTDESPHELVKRLSQKYDRLLLVGGGWANGLLLAENLVDEIFLTIEPHIFSEGKNIIEGLVPDTKLALIESSRLNNNGSLLLHYQVVKP